MKIAIHCDQFDNRGTGKVPLDYGFALRDILGHDVVFITSAQSTNEGLANIQKHFPAITYNKPPINKQSGEDRGYTLHILENLVKNERIDFMHMIKSGQNDGVTPRLCRTGVQCVFQMHDPHGHAYVGVSEYLANKYRRSEYIPHIIYTMQPTVDYRKKYNIPASAILLGRHGGFDTFNAEFVQTAIRRILQERSDIYFIFASTRQFMTHDRVIFLDWLEDQEKFNMIHSCDAMIHARMAGETFGIACGEFNASNKPIITWTGMGDKHDHDTCHLKQLGDSAILYNNEEEVMNIFRNISHSDIKSRNWDVYSTAFSPSSVISRYRKEFSI